jgi:uncharacterized protein (TIGR03067 family)
MRFQRLGFLTLAMIIGPGRALAEDAKKDLEKLQGNWVLVSAETKGKDITNNVKREFSMNIKGKKFVVEFGGNRFVRTIRVNSAKSPKEIDLGLPTTAKRELGIYALEGDKLKISWVTLGQGRPKGFATNAKTDQTTLVVKRKKR